ncbi:hypothetical protein [uncultured Oscillibacter sp.]|uniref:hypothetical protein n=1 Tax=uncultured Oscillibacter sp. TaxID=876091 RepID=UPI0025E464E2|nr:hypothetical protein [uncultured Oscillibacter sp.]
MGFLVVIYLTYKDWSVYLATFLGVCVVVLLNRLNFVTALTDTYVAGVYTAIKSFFFLMVFGCLQSYLYRESGAAFCIADTIMKKLIRDDASNTKKNLIGMAIILVIGTILNLGGIIAGVVIVLMYPIALAVFERCDIPKKFILGVLGAGCYTFTLTIPGSPQVTNVAAMSVLHTSAGVAMVPGLVGAVVEIIVILVLMNIMINKARNNGEHFVRHELDPATNPNMDTPGFLISVIPMAILFLTFNAFNLNIVVCLIFTCLLSIALF